MGTEATEKVSDYDNIVEFLNNYENSIGLKEWSYSSVVNDSMNLDANQLKQMTAEECSEMAYQILQYCAYLQRKINFEDSIINWANSKLELVIADKVQAYGGSGKSFITYDEKRMSAIKGDEAAQRLYIIKVAAENRLKRISFLPKRLEAMANVLTDLQYTKRNKQ